MSQKSVSDLIFDKFAESIKEDNLFQGISEEVDALIRGKKHIKKNLPNLLRKKADEDSKSGS